jgi:hypothetical protein
VRRQFRLKEIEVTSRLDQPLSSLFQFLCSYSLHSEIYSVYNQYISGYIVFVQQISNNLKTKIVYSAVDKLLYIFVQNYSAGSGFFIYIYYLFTTH